jgi:hypothetical protein
MKDRVPRGNGALCRVLGVKLRENAPSHTVENYYGKKYGQSMQNMLNGHNVNMSTYPDILYSSKHKKNELEKVQQYYKNKTNLEKLKKRLSKEKKNQIFNLEPEQFSPEVNVKHYHTSTRK